MMVNKLEQDLQTLSKTKNFKNIQKKIEKHDKLLASIDRKIKTKSYRIHSKIMSKKDIENNKKTLMDQGLSGIQTIYNKGIKSGKTREVSILRIILSILLVPVSIQFVSVGVSWAIVAIYSIVFAPMLVATFGVHVFTGISVGVGILILSIMSLIMGLFAGSYSVNTLSALLDNRRRNNSRSKKRRYSSRRNSRRNSSKKRRYSSRRNNSRRNRK